MMKKTPGPRAPPVNSLPSLKMTALSYSWNSESIFKNLFGWGDIIYHFAKNREINCIWVYSRSHLSRIQLYYRNISGIDCQSHVRSVQLIWWLPGQLWQRIWGRAAWRRAPGGLSPGWGGRPRCWGPPHTGCGTGRAGNNTLCYKIYPLLFCLSAEIAE